MSETKSLHHRTAAVGQAVTERTVSLLSRAEPVCYGALLPVEGKEMLAISEGVCLYKQALLKT